MDQGTGGGGEWVDTGIVDLTGVPLGELGRLVRDDPRVRANLNRVVEEVRRGDELVAGFNSSV
jgi:FXSXX-COOH protein